MGNDEIIINDSNSGEFESKNLKAPFTYFGEMKNGVPDGTGFAVWHGKWEGHTYEGEFKDCNICWGAMNRFYDWIGMQPGESKIGIGGSSFGSFLGKGLIRGQLTKILNSIQGGGFFSVFDLQHIFVDKKL